jgi:carboxyl-terminal processing protease
MRRALGIMRFALLVTSAWCLVGCGTSLGTAWGGSIGAVLTRDNATGQLTVRDAPEGKAAAKAGLLPGDELVAIEGRDVRRMTAEQVHSALEGSVGTKVKLTVQSETTPPHQVTIERGPLDKP